MIYTEICSACVSWMRPMCGGFSQTALPTISTFRPYFSPGFVIVKVHQSTGIFFNLAGVHELPGELDAVLDVRRASSPLPALFLVVVALFLPVAPAVAHVALAACGRHGVGDSSSCDGVGECRLPAAWGEERTDCDICSTHWPDYQRVLSTGFSSPRNP